MLECWKHSSVITKQNYTERFSWLQESVTCWQKSLKIASYNYPTKQIIGLEGKYEKRKTER